MSLDFLNAFQNGTTAGWKKPAPAVVPEKVTKAVAVTKKPVAPVKAVVVKEVLKTNQERVRLTCPDQNVLSILWVAKVCTFK